MQIHTPLSGTSNKLLCVSAVDLTLLTEVKQVNLKIDKLIENG